MALWQATFIFEKREYDDEFYTLDRQIEQATLQSTGYLGMESFRSADGKRLINNYYWSEREGMDASINDAHHLQAKQKSAQWIAGYQVIIAQIESTHNHQLEHPLQSFSHR
ncbi:hypothetical protein HV127_15600 [Klebsiella sp. RHBSTW-00215]|uniref:hypothetical protein n=1 Tax=Klebsiella sp. RHBSTW-00215 TaxID=2742640 RepID=UPI0015F5764B|nr:hypothetical protein [Klebsiella sp. RHBSTW-00215]MBA7932663.1 hypothetical protein [Klebsiella sp. RHBSTW-00215]